MGKLLKRGISIVVLLLTVTLGCSDNHLDNSTDNLVAKEELNGYWLVSTTKDIVKLTVDGNKLFAFNENVAGGYTEEYNGIFEGSTFTSISYGKYQGSPDTLTTKFIMRTKNIVDVTERSQLRIWEYDPKTREYEEKYYDETDTIFLYRQILE